MRRRSGSSPSGGVKRSRHDERHSFCMPHDAVASANPSKKWCWRGTRCRRPKGPTLKIRPARANFIAGSTNGSRSVPASLGITVYPSFALYWEGR